MDDRELAERRLNLAKYSNAEALHIILEDRELALIFRGFLHSLYSNENLAFWMVAEDYKTITNKKLRKVRAEEIYHKYFNPDSTYEVNIDGELKKELDLAMVDPDENTFNNIQKAIWRLMEMDSYPRFVGSEIYKNYQKELKKKFDEGSFSQANSSANNSPITSPHNHTGSPDSTHNNNNKATSSPTTKDTKKKSKKEAKKEESKKQSKKEVKSKAKYASLPLPPAVVVQTREHRSESLVMLEKFIEVSAPLPKACRSH